MTDDTTADVRLAVAAFDRVSPAAALELVRPVCASPAWMDAMVARRPHLTLEKIQDRSDTVIAGLSWQQVEKALSAHPRIGERSIGADVGAAWSRDEQAGVGDDLPTQLRDGNVAYEQKFGHVYLICATGRSSEDVLADLTGRLGHDRAQEQIAVRRELAAIARLRLAKVLV